PMVVRRPAGRARSGRGGTALPADGQLAELGPIVLGNGHVDDPGGLGQVWWQRLLRGLEVLGLDVRRPGVTVTEGLDQNVLVGVVHAPGPVEPQTARLGAARPGEVPDDLGPAVGVFRQDPELGGDEDHQALLCPGTWSMIPQDRRAAGRAPDAS